MLEVPERLLESFQVGGGLLVRVARGVDRVNPVQATADRGGAPASVGRIHGGNLQAELRELAGPGSEIERRLVEEQARTELGQVREVVEVDLVARVVLRVVLGAVELGRKRGDVDPGDSGREE